MHRQLRCVLYSEEIQDFRNSNFQCISFISAARIATPRWHINNLTGPLAAGARVYVYYIHISFNFLATDKGGYGYRMPLDSITLRCRHDGVVTCTHLVSLLAYLGGFCHILPGGMLLLRFSSDTHTHEHARVTHTDHN